MGKRKYEKIEELFSKSPVVDFNSVERIVKDNKGKNGYAKLIISNLIKQGKIYRLTKGFYTKENDPSLSVFCFKPAYLGLQSAMSLHRIWEQETIPIVLTTTKTRIGIRNINGANVYIRRIDKNHFFGYETLQDAGYYLPYSDVEKTFIDMCVFRQKITGETLEEFRKRINRVKLEEYLKDYSEKTARKIMTLITKNKKLNK
jgi:predicted transcriptional regulator of viral defense system